VSGQCAADVAYRFDCGSSLVQSSHDPSGRDVQKPPMMNGIMNQVRDLNICHVCSAVARPKRIVNRMAAAIDGWK
jgi:hypothetical protein